MKLQLYYPVRPFHVNQHFGDNLLCVKDFGLPSQGVTLGDDNTSCPMGFDKFYKHFGLSGHDGTDLAAGEQYVYAAVDGVVIEKQTNPSRGLGLGILTNEQYDFGTYGTHYIKIRYWHLKSFNCEVGDSITAGQLIGVSDNTGYSSGDHLHFEGQPMDKDLGGHAVLAFPNDQNGVIGSAIDIEPYFVGIYADTLSTTILWLKQVISLLIMELSILTKGRS